MKKVLLLFTLVLAFALGTSAQVMPSKFHDNTSIQLKGGINTPLNNFFDGISEQVGLQVQKDINPWLAFALDGDAYIKLPYNANPHTAFDQVNVNGLVKFNPINLFGTYPGYRRVFEWDVFTGIGWSHKTCKESLFYGHRNYGNYIAGTDFMFNLGKQKAWAIVLTPEVNWGMPETGKLSKNKANFEVNLGIVYHFKNKDGNRYFTKAKLYDQDEIDGYICAIDQLTAANEELMTNNITLQSLLEQKPKTVVEEVTIEKPYYVLPPVQFLFNSSAISETSHAAVVEIANVILLSPNDYLITGYASDEGTEEYNICLSQARAESMKAALVECGVNPDRLKVYGAGITTQFSTEDPALNRIVTVTCK